MKDKNISTKIKEGAKYYLGEIKAKNEKAILHPFLSNHDMDRSAGYLRDESMKVAANLYMLTAGNPFIYYGEEIGMKGARGTANTDANRRLAMLWGDNDTVKDPIGTTYDSSKQLNGTLQLISDYPAWEYAKNSQLEKMCIDAYKNLTGNEPIIMALHAGLECGLLLEKMPHAEAISFGPNMYDVHTPNEHLSISSTENTWKFLLAVLKSMK